MFFNYSCVFCFAGCTPPPNNGGKCPRGLAEHADSNGAVCATSNNVSEGGQFFADLQLNLVVHFSLLKCSVIFLFAALVP